MEFSADFGIDTIVKIEPHDIDDFDDNFGAIGETLNDTNNCNVFNSEMLLHDADESLAIKEEVTDLFPIPPFTPTTELNDSSLLVPFQPTTIANESRPYPCEFCGKGFTRKSHLTRHRILHTGEKPYPCEMCEERFTRPENRRRHVAQMHRRDFLYACEMCGKRFGTLQQKSGHMQVHSSERLCPCTICGKTYAGANSLAFHMKTHNITVKPADIQPKGRTRQIFECTDCGKEFTRRDHMLRHQNSHTGARPFTCNICTKSFSRKDNLLKHQTTCMSRKLQVKSWATGSDDNDPLGNLDIDLLANMNATDKSEQCKPESIFPLVDPIAMLQKTNLPITLPNSKDGSVEIFLVKKQNKQVTKKPPASSIQVIQPLERRRRSLLPELTPEEELTLNCNICNKKLSQKHHLQRHKLAHLPVRPYQCNLCSKSFTRNEHLKRHRFSHIRNPNGINSPINGSTLNGNNLNLPNICTEEQLDSASIKTERPDPSDSEDFNVNINDDASASIKTELPDASDSEDFNVNISDDLANDLYESDGNYLNSFLEVSMTTTDLTTKKCVKIEDDNIDVDFDIPQSSKENSKANAGTSFSHYSCDKCDKWYTKPYLLARHYTFHTGEKKYKCEICDRGFTRLEHRKRHMTIHSQQKNYECDRCPKKFTRADHLLSHTKQAHPEVRPYRCIFLCGERFETLQEKLAHAQLRNCSHRCSVCKTKFSSHGQLLYHNLVAHSNGECSVVPTFPKEKMDDVKKVENDDDNNTESIIEKIKDDWDDETEGKNEETKPVITHIKTEWDDPLDLDDYSN